MRPEISSSGMTSSLGPFEDGHDMVRRNRGFLRHDSSALPSRDRHDRRQLRYELDLNSWNLRIWGVAASGFLTDSPWLRIGRYPDTVVVGMPIATLMYNLFASNVILASVSYVYWPNEKWPALVINIFTLLGSVVGQLLFGFLADWVGRTRLYGIELVLVIVSTVGVATSSYGYNDMNFLALFTWWRFVMGVGIGAEYPLSAVITAEWSSTASRATMLSSVFLMQPVGQALAQLVGVWVLLGREREDGLSAKQCGINTLHEEECKKIIDGIWRIVIGSGAIPALLAIVFRFFLYDCGIYSLEVKHKPGTALRNTQRIYGHPGGSQNDVALYTPGGGQIWSPPPQPIQFSKADLYHYLVVEKNWYYLLGTAATWFFLDISFYGFSLDNRGTLSDLWAATNPAALNSDLVCWTSSLEGGNSTLPQWASNNGFPSWQTDHTKPCSTIYDILLEQAKQYLLTVSISSIAGSACFIFAANRLRRREWLTWSFVLLTILFLVTGGTYYSVAHTRNAPATVILVAICHFVFNFGANTLTFMIPAEIFPTCYRCTSHGISAAAGKLGSIIAVLVVFGINRGYDSPTRQGLIFLLFSLFMAFGALYSWAYLPNIQKVAYDSEGHRRLETKSLEDLGEGREKARIEGEVITMKKKWSELKRTRRQMRNPVSHPY